jgi:lambda family phage portal protein
MSGPNFLDRAIGYVAPRWAERRAKARRVMEANRLRDDLMHRQADLLKRKMDAAAASTARFHEHADDDERRPAFGSAQHGVNPADALELDLADLRAKHRYLYTADDYFAGAVEGCIMQTVGKGMRPQAGVTATKQIGGVPAISATVADDCNAVLEQIWKEVEGEFTIDGLSFGEMNEQSLFHNLLDGTGALLLYDEPRSGRPISLAAESIDPWLIETPPGKDKHTKLGVEYRNGRPVLVHWRKDWDVFEHASAPPDRMLLSFRHRWSKQPLGLPWATACLTRCYDLKAMREAELISAQVAACFSMWIESDNPWRADDEATAAAGGQTETRRFKNMRPGAILYGRQGEKAQPINPNRPGDNFAPFTELNLRGLGAGINYPYEYLANDFSKTSYLSGRMSQILGRELFLRLQLMLIRRQNQHVWKAFVPRCVMAGHLPISARQYVACRATVEQHRWQPRGWMWIDPSKDIRANKEALESWQTTYRAIFEQGGEDMEEQFEQRAYEERLKRQKGFVDKDADADDPPPDRRPRDDDEEDDDE